MKTQTYLTHSLLFCFYICLSGISRAQGVPDVPGLPMKDEHVFFEEVVTPKDSAKKAKIFLAAKDWVSKTFKSSKAVIDYEDKEEGKLVAKGNYLSDKYNSDQLFIEFTMDFTIKDNKYRMQVYNLAVEEQHLAVLSGGLNPYYPKTVVDIDRMNKDYVEKADKPRFKRKFSAQILTLTSFHIKALMESAKTSINKTLLAQKSNEF